MKTKEDNLVSVIVPTYNRAKFITKALDSVWEQTYRPIEVLIVDDGSTDNTQAVVEQWKKEHQGKGFFIKYIAQANSGAPAARNNGVKNATGRYLQFLDSDDLLVPEKLELQIDRMKKENTSLCLSDIEGVDEQLNRLKIYKKDYSINYFIRKFKATNTSAPLLDRSFFSREVLLWNENLDRLQDIEYFIKILMLIPSKSYIEKPLFRWVSHSGERISGYSNQGEPTVKDRGIYTSVFRSIFIFHRKHSGQISLKKLPSIGLLYLNLLYMASFLKPIVRYIRTGGAEG